MKNEGVSKISCASCDRRRLTMATPLSWDILRRGGARDLPRQEGTHASEGSRKVIISEGSLHHNNPPILEWAVGGGKQPSG